MTRPRSLHVAVIALTACATTTAPPTTSPPPVRTAPSDEPPPPPPAPDPTPEELAKLQIDPRAVTPLDDLAGSWSCDRWLQAASSPMTLTIARGTPARPAYAIPFTWTITFSPTYHCDMIWSAHPTRGVSFERGTDFNCNFNLHWSGSSSSGWKGNTLAMTLSGDPHPMRIPEDKGPYPPPPTASLEIVRHGTSSMELVLDGTSTTCRRS